MTFWPIALRGTAATFMGIGLARFAFVPLFPAMVAAGWVDGEGAGLLGAMSLAGYLAGALSGQALARRVGVPRALDAGAALAALAFLACAWNGGLAWLGLWRSLAGLAGAVGAGHGRVCGGAGGFGLPAGGGVRGQRRDARGDLCAGAAGLGRRAGGCHALMV